MASGSLEQLSAVLAAVGSAALIGGTVVGLPAAAAAGPPASLYVTLSPNRAGARTLLGFAFQISSPEGLPPALTHLAVALPKGLGIDMAGMGTCRPARLEGGGGCAANAQVGQGSVTVAVPLGEQVRTERAKLTVFRGPTHPTRPTHPGTVKGDQTLIFDAVGRVPIATRIVFTAIIAPGARGPSIQASIPLEATLPGSPDAAITSLTSTLGTLHRTYFTSRGHRPFTPRGITLPHRCPAGGLRFKATLAFDNGSETSVSATAACQKRDTKGPVPATTTRVSQN